MRSKEVSLSIKSLNHKTFFNVLVLNRKVLPQ